MTNSNASGSDADERDADITDESRFEDLVEEIDDDSESDADSDADTDPKSDEADTTPESITNEDSQSESDQPDDDGQPGGEPGFMQQSRQRTTPSGSKSTAASLSLRRKIQIGLLVFFSLLLLVSLVWEFL
ncbi:hypothetical protein EGH24_05525 [Halonotius terrestris]|uniref:Uncharacterized protein n=1 Tax=Halonotius terrestris TaxID=2487750 RepID=A0A8J8PCY2_9EURY|nr:hypothetical protein [Halonotius terrestris]TQQ82897.1 hypothetical protein EGH24_05525 [Halonotius terrestris]